MPESSSTASHVIVVGVDGSDPSKDALRWAAGQAELTGNALEVVMVWDESTEAFAQAETVPAGLNLGEFKQHTIDDAIRQVLGQHLAIKVTTTMAEGSPAAALLNAAKSADMLVVGKRGHKGIAGRLLGSVSQHCVEHAYCPVVVVHHDHGAA